MQNFFLVLAFFLFPISIIAQSEENNQRLETQERELKAKPKEEKKDSITFKDYKIFYEDGTSKNIFEAESFFFFNFYIAEFLLHNLLKNVLELETRILPKACGRNFEISTGTKT